MRINAEMRATSQAERQSFDFHQAQTQLILSYQKEESALLKAFFAVIFCFLQTTKIPNHIYLVSHPSSSIYFIPVSQPFLLQL